MPTEKNYATSETVTELLKLVYLNYHTLNALIDTLTIRKGEEQKKQILSEKTLTDIKSTILSGNFLAPTIEKIQLNFTEFEAQTLINIYKTDEMKNFSNFHESIFSSLFKSITIYIDQYTGKASLWTRKSLLKKNHVIFCPKKYLKDASSS